MRGESTQRRKVGNRPQSTAAATISVVVVRVQKRESALSRTQSLCAQSLNVKATRDAPRRQHNTPTESTLLVPEQPESLEDRGTNSALWYTSDPTPIRVVRVRDFFFESRLKRARKIEFFKGPERFE